MTHRHQGRLWAGPIVLAIAVLAGLVSSAVPITTTTPACVAVPALEAQITSRAAARQRESLTHGGAFDPARAFAWRMGAARAAGAGCNAMKPGPAGDAPW